MDPFEVLHREPQDPPHVRSAVALRQAHALLGWLGLRRVVIAVAVCAAGGVGGWWLLRAPAPGVEQQLPYASGSSGPAGRVDSARAAAAAVAAAAEAGATASTQAGAPSVLVVHVAGAVAHPGLVQLANGARVADAVAAAGGPSADADLDALNLAAFAVDAGRVYVPHVGEAVSATDLPGSGGGAVPALRVDLNTATASDLDKLPGIGPSLAAAVVAYRSANGPFRTVDALLKVPGIGPAKLEQFRALVRV